VLTATGFVNEIKFDPPPQNPHPSTHHQKFVAGNYLQQIFGDGLKGVDFVGGGGRILSYQTQTQAHGLASRGKNSDKCLLWAYCDRAYMRFVCKSVIIWTFS